MYKVLTEPDPGSPEATDVQENWHRRTMEEIRVAVTRGAAGIQASYFCDQGTSRSFASEHED